MSIQRQVEFEMLTAEIGLVICLAADFPCLPVAEQHTMTRQRSSGHDGQEMTMERHTCLSCAVATSTTGGW
jgi:hypothetical protein